MKSDNSQSHISSSTKKKINKIKKSFSKNRIRKKKYFS